MSVVVLSLVSLDLYYSLRDFVDVVPLGPHGRVVSLGGAYALPLGSPSLQLGAPLQRPTSSSSKNVSISFESEGSEASALRLTFDFEF